MLPNLWEQSLTCSSTSSLFPTHVGRMHPGRVHSSPSTLCLLPMAPPAGLRCRDAMLTHRTRVTTLRVACPARAFVFLLPLLGSEDQ